jgi:hypothetical protein
MHLSLAVAWGAFLYTLNQLCHGGAEERGYTFEFGIKLKEAQRPSLCLGLPCQCHA